MKTVKEVIEDLQTKDPDAPVLPFTKDDSQSDKEPAI
jgi:hypothetical protein